MSKSHKQGALNQLDDMLGTSREGSASSSNIARSMTLELELQSLSVQSSNKNQITFSHKLDSVEKESAKDIIESFGATNVRLTNKPNSTVAEFSL